MKPGDRVRILGKKVSGTLVRPWHESWWIVRIDNDGFDTVSGDNIALEKQ